MAEDPWARKLGDAYENWAVDELIRVGQRNFDFSKHLFTVSAGSFAVFSYIHQGFSLDNYFLALGLLFLALSVLLSILIAEPPDFRIDGAENLVEKHTSYSCHGKALRRLWLAFWMLGIALIVIAPEIRGTSRNTNSSPIDVKGDE